MRPYLPISLAGQLLPFISFLDKAGSPWRSALARARLPGEIADPAGFLPSNGILTFISDMASREGLPDLGYRVNQVDCSGAIHPKILMAIQTAPTLYAALKAGSEQMRLQGSHFQIWLHESNDYLWVCYKGSVPATWQGAEQGEYFRITRLVEVIRQFLGRDWHPQQLYLETPLKPPAALISFVGNCVYKTGMPYGAMPLSYNQIAVSAPDTLSKAKNSGPGTPQSAGANQEDWYGHIVEILPAYLPAGGLALPDLADIASLSPRTLQRLLEERGTSYRELMDAARFGKASHLLLETDLSATEIARLSGYTDSSNFARAFRRISGRSPSEYRQDFKADHR